MAGGFTAFLTKKREEALHFAGVHPISINFLCYLSVQCFYSTFHGIVLKAGRLGPKPKSHLVNVEIEPATSQECLGLCPRLGGKFSEQNASLRSLSAYLQHSFEAKQSIACFLHRMTFPIRVIICSIILAFQESREMKYIQLFLK